MACGKTVVASRIRHELVDREHRESSHIKLGGNRSISRSNGKNWLVVKDVLLDVIEMNDRDRSAFLSSPDIAEEVRDEVASLLQYSAQNDSFLEQPAVAHSKDTLAMESATSVTNGLTIGSYTIDKELGLGGMGAVYLATRTDGKFNQQVALKLLRREFSVGSVREAFQREIDIQSSLVHPNIARILDTGTTDDGIPYIAMEYVEGEPVDLYCFRRNLSLRDRLKLFNKACEGVAFAHSNLVIHRDIKPANIIVTADGLPKLIDFGISKLADSDANAHTLFGAMTPEYASPEQISGKAVSTATDIFSLAVVLYKLTAGTLPLDVSANNGADAKTIICETEPRLPSSATTERGIASSQLVGDIDNIILKALRKDPAERYQTVEQFADDIWRSMDGLPVRARASTFSYRSAKFIRRNRIAVAAASAVLITLIAGIAIAGWQSRVAQAESANARSEQAKSEKMARYMAKIIGYANPSWYAEGAKQKGEARVIDALNELADKIDSDFPNDIDIAAELHYRFAEVFGWVVKNKTSESEKEEYREKARKHHLRALELRTQYYGDWHELVAKDLYYAKSMLSSDPNEQCRIFDRSINMMRSTNPTNRNFPFMLTDYAAFISYEDNNVLSKPCLLTVSPKTTESPHEIAIRYYYESIPYMKLHFPNDESPIAYAECRLGVSLARQGNINEATRYRNTCAAYVEKTQSQADKSSRLADVEKIDKALAEFAR